MIGRRGMVRTNNKPKEEKQETPSEKNKRMKEMKIRQSIFDVRQLKDKIAEMLDTKDIKDIIAFRFLLIHTHKTADSGPTTIMKMNRMDITMMKLWKRALPRRIHDEKGIFFKQAMFTLRIEQEIQPLWDNTPENKETIRFRKIMSHFIIDKSVTQRERIITRRWNEGYKTSPELKEASGPHAILTYISESKIRKQNIGKDNRRKREKREEEWRKLPYNL